MDLVSVSFTERTRAYQKEMFDESMKGNRIIVMDTGSGKTQIALLRIHAELNRCGNAKRIWFLAPSVELCVQQHNVLQRAMPAYKTRLLTGQDNVEKWSQQSTWDAALDQVRIVVSTHAILLDALRHAFVSLEGLALLVFDGAHHCIKKHPANMIMKNFYHELRAEGSTVPAILGLSASLIMSSSLYSVASIEANLDSISVTPRINRQDLMRHVFRPDCRILRYNMPNISGKAQSQGLQALKSAVIQHASSCAAAESTSFKCNNDVQHALIRLYEKAAHIDVELGPCATEYFIRETISLLRKRSGSTADLQLDLGQTAVSRLLAILTDARIEEEFWDKGRSSSSVSPKVQCLLDYLLQDPSNDLCGMVFVNQRAVACVLSSLLNDSSLTHGRLRCVCSVGSSNSSARKFSITELVDRHLQKQALPSFRQGGANIIVATSVLEEGIDVQACNVVACFDLPTNLKSYIQRRGRARHQHSRYGILLGPHADATEVARWHELERELTAICQRDRQQAAALSRVEAEDECTEYALQVESTGAKLDSDSTLQHLNHFCQLFQSESCPDARPIFSYEENASGLIRANVALPHSVPAHARHASGKRAWRTKQAARKDAAFHAYATLFDAGLLNDHLLPISQEWNVNEGLAEEAPPARLHVDTLPLWNPSKSGNHWHELEIQISPSGRLCSTQEPSLDMILNTHQQLSVPPILELHWDSRTSFAVRFRPSTRIWNPSEEDLRMMHSFTSAMYRAPRSEHHWEVGDELLTLFKPLRHDSWHLDLNDRQLERTHGKHLEGLVRVASRSNAPYLFHEWTEDDAVVCTPLPRRRDFSVATEPKDATEQGDSVSCLKDLERREVFAAHECYAGALSVPWARVGLFMPNILQHVHDYTLVDRLADGLLRDISPLDHSLIRTAITAPSAQRPYNYQRLEFLGDCVLKYVTSCHLFNDYPNWPEGYLSQRRALLVCNATLASGAIRTGLSPYIISEPNDFHNWILPTAKPHSSAREISIKTLADVVEALIGATWLEAGMNTAKQCISIFVPTVMTNIQPPHKASSKRSAFGNCVQIEALIGHTFTWPGLLAQALTHPSYAQISGTESYERLEYLGDAVLDMLITELLAENIKTLTQGRMTQIKAAVVNAEFLAFLCFNLKSTEGHRTIDTTIDGKNPKEVVETYELSLANYLRFHPDVSTIFQESRNRYNRLQQLIQQELRDSASHPWVELKRLNANKMFSDMVESILGAIFLDCGQELGACRNFLQRLGLSQYVQRLIDDEIDVKYREGLPYSTTDSRGTSSRRLL